MTSIPPVEALQREIDRVNLLLAAQAQTAWPGGIASQTWHNYLAALELAKADAEYQEFVADGDACGSYTGIDKQYAAIVVARAKLYEALQK